MISVNYNKFNCINNAGYRYRYINGIAIYIFFFKCFTRLCGQYRIHWNNQMHTNLNQRKTRGEGDIYLLPFSSICNLPKASLRSRTSSINQYRSKLYCLLGLLLVVREMGIQVHLGGIHISYTAPLPSILHASLSLLCGHIT